MWIQLATKMKVFINFNYEYIGKEYFITEPKEIETDIIIADNRIEAVKYSLFDRACNTSCLDKENKKNEKEKGEDYIYDDKNYGCYFDCHNVITFILYENHTELLLIDDEELKNISEHRFRRQFTQEDLRNVFEQFCLDNFGNKEHYTWTYDEFDKKYQDLYLTLLNNNVIVLVNVSDFHMVYERLYWLNTMVEYEFNDDHLMSLFFDIKTFNKESTDPEECYENMNEEYFRRYYKLFTKDDIDTLNINIDSYVKTPFDIHNHNYNAEIRVIKKPEFIIDHDAAKTIQKGWKDALVDPNCKIGLTRINRDYDNMIQRAL